MKQKEFLPPFHLRIIIFGLKTVHIGSANITGSGMKGKKTQLSKNTAKQFDSIWMDAHWKGYKQKKYCVNPIGG